MGIAFFDLDKTLLRASSSSLYVRHLWRRRLISVREVLWVAWVSAQYSLNRLDFPRAMARLSRRIKGGDAVFTKRLCDEWVREELVHYVAPKALARVREHQAKGDLVIVLSASTQFVVAPLAEHLGLPYRCTELEVVDGRFTGEIVGEACFGQGKRYWGERLAEAHGVSLRECTFYTDSYTDLPLLEAVGCPVAVNPDRKLARYAAQRGWRVERFY